MRVQSSIEGQILGGFCRNTWLSFWVVWKFKAQLSAEYHISFLPQHVVEVGSFHSSELNWAPNLMWFLPKHMVEVWVVLDFGAELNAKSYEFTARTHGGGLGRLRIRSSIELQILCGNCQNTWWGFRSFQNSELNWAPNLIQVLCCCWLQNLSAAAHGGTTHRLGLFVSRRIGQGAQVVHWYVVQKQGFQQMRSLPVGFSTSATHCSTSIFLLARNTNHRLGIWH